MRCLEIAGTNAAFDVCISNSRFSCNTGSRIRCLWPYHVGGLCLWNTIFKTWGNATYDVPAIWFATSFPATVAIENCVFDTCRTGIVNADKAHTYRTSVFIGCDTNIATPTNSTSVNCAAGAAAVGAATDTNPQVSLTAADEFINTTITDLVDGYRLKSATSTKLKSNGAAPGIAANTADIFGRARPDGAAGYSIGVAERAIPAITAADKTTATGTNFKPAATDPTATYDSAALTLVTATNTQVTYANRTASGTLRITNSDGEYDEEAVAISRRGVVGGLNKLRSLSTLHNL